LTFGAGRLLSAHSSVKGKDDATGAEGDEFYAPSPKMRGLTALGLVSRASNSETIKPARHVFSGGHGR
jgi:hypothetical protein